MKISLAQNAAKVAVVAVLAVVPLCGVSVLSRPAAASPCTPKAQQQPLCAHVCDAIMHLTKRAWHSQHEEQKKRGQLWSANGEEFQKSANVGRFSMHVCVRRPAGPATSVTHASFTPYIRD